MSHTSITFLLVFFISPHGFALGTGVVSLVGLVDVGGGDASGNVAGVDLGREGGSEGAREGCMVASLGLVGDSKLC